MRKGERNIKKGINDVSEEEKKCKVRDGES